MRILLLNTNEWMFYTQNHIIIVHIHENVCICCNSLYLSHMIFHMIYYEVYFRTIIIFSPITNILMPVAVFYSCCLDIDFRKCRTKRMSAIFDRMTFICYQQNTSNSNHMSFAQYENKQEKKGDTKNISIVLLNSHIGGGHKYQFIES